MNIFEHIGTLLLYCHEEPLQIRPHLTPGRRQTKRAAATNRPSVLPQLEPVWVRAFSWLLQSTLLLIGSFVIAAPCYPKPFYAWLLGSQAYRHRTQPTSTCRPNVCRNHSNDTKNHASMTPQLHYHTTQLLMTCTDEMSDRATGQCTLNAPGQHFSFCLPTLQGGLCVCVRVHGTLRLPLVADFCSSCQDSSS